MTESPGVAPPPIVVSQVMPGDPPFRIVQIGGQQVGKAFSPVDVIEFARRAGLDDVDLDDPSVVQWVGGDKFKWTL
ncbi:MAG: hypothetical protein QOI83_3923 [Streptomycetaceae bacterium]|nr:hypothetical protein [Streptomycetaceae bacterium]